MDPEQKPFVPKTPMDFQKLKLERLMANPDKPVIIPDMPKEKKGFSVPEFVRNVMGSSAGAGSGEFHVYRHLRRKEYTRQKMIDEKADKERLDEEYRDKIEENKRKMEDRTAKKRAKRLRKKHNLKQKLKEKRKQSESKPKKDQDTSEESKDESQSDSNEDDTEKNSESVNDCDENTHESNQTENVPFATSEDSIPSDNVTNTADIVKHSVVKDLTS